MAIEIKKVALFVILPLLLMSFVLSMIGTSNSFTANNHPKTITSVYGSPSKDTCNELSCKIHATTPRV